MREVFAFASTRQASTGGPVHQIVLVPRQAAWAPPPPRLGPRRPRRPRRNVGGNLLARCAARRVAQLALLQRQLVQALGAARPVSKDSWRAVVWRHEYERQVNPSRFACMFCFEKIPRSLQPARERSGRARASSAETWEVTCLRGVATYTSHVAVEVCEQQVRYG